MNKCKKLIALLLAVLFVLPLGVLGVFAEDVVTEPTDLITAENTKVEVSNPNGSYPANRVVDGEKYGRSPMATTGNTSKMSWYELTFGEAITLNKFVTYYSDQQFESRSGDFALDVKLENGSWIRVAEVHDDYTVYPKYFYNEDGSQKTYGDLGWTQEKNEVVSYLTRHFTFSAVTITALRFTARTGKVYNSKTGSTVRGSQHYVEFEAYLDETVTEYTGVNSPATSNDVITNRNFAHANFDDQWYDYAYNMGTASLSSPNAAFKVESANDEAYPNQKGTVAVSMFDNTTQVSHYQINFAAPITTNAVKIYAPDQVPNVPADYAVDVKDEYGVWTRVVEIHGLSTATYRYFYFAPQTGVVAIRVSANKSGNTNCNNFMMRSLHVGFLPEKTPSDYTGVTAAEDAILAIPAVRSDNLALTGTVSVNKHLTGTITNVNDGKYSSLYAASYENGISWYQVDLAKELPVSRIFIECPNESAKVPADYAVDVKTANGYWVRVAEVHGATVPASTRNFYFEPIKAVAVRLTANRKGNSESGNFMMREFEIYHDPAVTTYSGITKPNDSTLAIPEYLSDNFATGATASTNKQLSAFDVNRIVDGQFALNDGNKIAIASYESNIAWFQVDLKSAKNINNVVIRHSFEPNKAPTRAAIDVKKADGTWVRVAESHTLAAGGSSTLTREFKFAEFVNAVAVRYTAYNTSGNLAVGEFEVYYNGNVTEADYTGVTKADDAVIPYSISDNYAIGAKVSNVATDEVNIITNINDGKKANDSAFAGTALGNGIGYFEFDFAKATTVNQVTVYRTREQFNNSPKDFAIDVQLADGTWVRKVAVYDVARSGDWGSNATTFSFEAVEAVKVRVSFSAKRVNTDRYTHVYFTEIEIFNNPNVTANDYTGIAAADDWKYDILAVDHVKADQDGNGAVDSNDLVASKKTILGVTAEALKADVNGDYVINILDYIATAKEIAE